MKSPTKQPKFLNQAGHLLAAVAAGLLAATQAQAATVTFSSPITITSDAVLDQPLSYPGATLLDAKKWGGSATAVTTAGAAQVINFTQGTTANADMPGTSTTTILYNGGTQSSVDLFPGTTGNGDFDTVLRCNAWHNNASDAVRPLCLRLGGLTIGTKYVISLFTADARAGSSGRMQQYYDTFAAGVFSGGASVSFSQSPANVVIATFTADAATQDIFVRETDNAGNDDTHLVGFTLYSVTAFAPTVGDISISPTNVAYAGESRLLSTSPTGPIDGYRWEWDNATGGAVFSVISGANSTSYTQDTTGLLGTYQYRFIATNASSSATSAVATLTVNAATVPFIVTDTTPAGWNGYTTLGVTFSAAFDGNHPITYQWQVDKGSGYTNIPNATNVSLFLNNLQLGDAGNYQLAATNPIGDSASSPAVLTVNDIALAKYGWQPPVPFNGLNADQILTNVAGAFVGAAAFGNAGELVTLGDGRILNFSTDGSIATATGLGTAAGAYPGVTTVSTTNANFDAVLNRFSWDGGPKTITLNNLVMGEQYSVQIFALDDRGGDISARLGNFQDPADAGDVSATFAMGDNVYVVGTFLAANTSETIQMNLPTGNNGSLNALVLRALSYTPTNQPPNITVHPASQTVFAGRSAQFTVAADSYVLPTYQWQSGPAGGPYTDLNNGGVVSGATSNVLVISDATAYDGSEFQAVVSNPAGSDTSLPALLTVVPVPPTSGANESSVLALGPLAYWPLNETNDVSAGGASAYDAAGPFDGIYLAAAQNAFNGVVGVQPEDGYAGFDTNQGALRSTGNTDQSWITTPPLNLNTNTATIGMWIYPEGIQPGPVGLYVNRNAGTVAGLGYYGTDRLGYKWNNDAAETWGFNTGPLIPTDIWSYVAVVIEPTQATLYLYNTNGLQTAVNTTTHNNMTWGGSQSNIRIGCDNSAGTAFNGRIDEVTVFNRALSQSEVLTLAGNTAPVTPPSLTIERTGADIVLTWSAGLLLEADGITGPWTTNAVTSPYTNTPTGAQKFFRAVAP
jgi:hypothetical protein